VTPDCTEAGTVSGILPWEGEPQLVRREAQLVAFVCLVYLVFLVEPDKPDEPDRPQTTRTGRGGRLAG